MTWRGVAVAGLKGICLLPLAVMLGFAVWAALFGPGN
jgi:hypothetical protein